MPKTCGFDWTVLPLLAVLAVAPRTSIAAAGEPEAHLGNRVEVIVIGGVPTRGWVVLPATDSEFRFKLHATEEIVTLNWGAVDESDRKRVQKLYGLEIIDDKKVFGRKLKGVVMRLENGVVRGLRLPDRDRSGEKAIRCATQPLLMIPVSDIKSEEEAECFESEFYSERDIYDRMLMENPPGNNDAAAHLKYATEAANMGLYKEALDHLTKAEIIDARTKDRNKDMRMQLIADAARKEGEKLFQLLVKYYVGQDFFAAFDVMEKFNRQFPNHELKSRVDQMKAEIEEGVKIERNKRVILMAYRIAGDLVQQRLFKKVKIDEKGNYVASLPGKMVTTTRNHIFRGVLIDPDMNGSMVLKVGETTLSIKTKEIASVQDVDLSQGVKEVSQPFDELRRYVEDASSPTGLKGEMLARIAFLLKIPLEEVRGIFENRLEKIASYDNGQYVATKTWVTFHDANFGRGSWLRAGARPKPWVSLGTTADDPNVNPDASDDPLLWWKYQNAETQLELLRALMAEKIFKVHSDQKKSCHNCGGGGEIYMTNSEGKPVLQRCALCRGLGKLVKILYQ
jgi:hypothetical protein